MDGQTSNTLGGTGLGYAAPIISGISGVFSSMPTGGGDTFMLSGNMFGPASGYPNWVRYGLPGVNGVTRYTAGTPDAVTLIPYCTVTVAHTQISCVTAPGTGRGFSVQAAVGGQASNVFAANIGYGAPVMTAFTPSTGMATPGGENVVITGLNFGPVNDPAAPIQAIYSTPRTGGGRFTFTPSNCTITQPNVAIACTTAPGAGANLQVRAAFLFDYLECAALTAFVIRMILNHFLDFSLHFSVR